MAPLLYHYSTMQRERQVTTIIIILQANLTTLSEGRRGNAMRQ